MKDDFTYLRLAGDFVFHALDNPTQDSLTKRGRMRCGLDYGGNAIEEVWPRTRDAAPVYQCLHCFPA